MTASRLRRVGTRGLLIDPGAVIAIYLTTRPHVGVDVILEGGIRLNVTDAHDLGRPVTGDDVAKVHHQLTARST